jgi:hypothetical protein
MQVIDRKQSAETRVHGILPVIDHDSVLHVHLRTRTIPIP